MRNVTTIHPLVALALVAAPWAVALVEFVAMTGGAR